MAQTPAAAMYGEFDPLRETIRLHRRHRPIELRQGLAGGSMMMQLRGVCGAGYSNGYSNGPCTTRSK